jgi:hypothetical protein
LYIKVQGTSASKEKNKVLIENNNYNVSQKKKKSINP